MNGANRTSWFSILTVGLLLLNQAGAQVIFHDRFEPPETRFEATWSNDTVRLSGDSVNALEDVDEAGEVYTFSTAALDAAGVSYASGDIMLIDGIALRRVESVSQSGGSTVLVTSTAALNEAIVSGEMEWNLDIGFDQVAAGEAYVPGRAADCSPGGNEQTVTFECTVDDYTMSLELTRNGTTSSIEYKVVKGTEEANASFTGTGVLSEFDSSGGATFDGGELTSFQHNTQDTQMDINITLAAAGSGSASLDHEIPFPIIRIPFTVGPIPMSIDIGVQFVVFLNVPLEAQASAQAEANFRYRGDTGFTYEGSSVEAGGTINGHDIFDGMFDSASLIGASVDAGFGIAFPRISLSVLTSEVAWVHTGFIAESHLRWGPICKIGIYKVVLEGGYQLEIMGVELLSEKKTFAEEDRREESDPDQCAEYRPDDQ
ncbi:hypothetical protein [Wenzhouxiangella sp. EGI_FJ10305]|uniref:hypothetical protein n=1 Tax=Wenzhouxiangella sp. EGI_FJ10305 TaxID=3243768 RepID=UPI0035E26930